MMHADEQLARWMQAEADENMARGLADASAAGRLAVADGLARRMQAEVDENMARGLADASAARRLAVADGLQTREGDGAEEHPLSVKTISAEVFKHCALGLCLATGPGLLTAAGFGLSCKSSSNLPLEERVAFDARGAEREKRERERAVAAASQVCQH
jgi:hypothetical protein